MSLIDFESAREKEKKREWEREARNAILERAKNKYDSEKQEEEARRQRGEHTWMLPSVESKLQTDKKKKKKKEKKKKKQKKKKKNDSSSSSSNESDEEQVSWVEKPSVAAPVAKSTVSSTQDSPKPSQEAARRDGWMEMTSLFKTYSRNQIREKDGTSRKKAKEEERRQQEEAKKAITQARELNPFFKDGGTGLPQEENGGKTAPPPVSMGLDASWLRKALQRAKEQAETENTTLEEVAARRWGSLDKFNELLAQAEGRGGAKVQDKWSRRQSSLEQRNKNRERKRSKSVERKRSRSRDRRRSRSRDRGRSRSGDRRRSRSRDRARSKSRERRRSSSIGRKIYGNTESSKDTDRYSRSKSSERSSKSSNNDDIKDRHGSREKRDKGRHRRSRSSSSASSSSSSSRGSGHRESKKNRDQIHKRQLKIDSSQRSSSLMKPPDDGERPQKSSLSSRFHRPGEDSNRSRQSGAFGNKGPSSGASRGWQKKEYLQEERLKMRKNEINISSSSSSSSSSESEAAASDKEELPPTAKDPEKPSSSTTTDKSSEKAVFLTDKEMNELAAKIMKAELIGNDNLASKLKNKLEAARTARKNAPTDMSGGDAQSGAKEELVVLTRTDVRGFSRPVNVTEPGEYRKKKQGKMQTHGKDGKRNKYFPDDDKYSLKQMFEAEKGTTADEQNSMFNRAAMQNHERLNDDYDMDDMFMSKAALKEDSAKQAERDRKRAIDEHQRSERSLESCRWCFESKDMAKHLIVALGTKAYVCLPPHESLTPGHCLIVPVHHVMSSVNADEDLWSEIMNFRKSLVKMFISRGEDCIFFEAVKRLRNFPHMTIHCVPLPKEMGDMAPIYFKKAIMECEAEWAQNKKLVDLKNRDVRRAVPKGLPYFFVDFAMDSGFAHVIEDEQSFPTNFAQEIVGGMLDLETNLWRKPRKENFDAQRRKVMEFSRWYKEFDITQEENE